MKQAWVENDQIRDVAQGDPKAVYHPDVAALYSVSVPDDAVNGDGFVKGKLVKPEIVAPVEVKEVVAPESLLTPTERIAIAIQWSDDLVLQKLISLDVLLEGVDLLDYLAGKGLIADGRKDAILTEITK